MLLSLVLIVVKPESLTRASHAVTIKLQNRTPTLHSAQAHWQKNDNRNFFLLHMTKYFWERRGAETNLKTKWPSHQIWRSVWRFIWALVLESAIVDVVELKYLFHARLYVSKENHFLHINKTEPRAVKAIPTPISTQLNTSRMSRGVTNSFFSLSICSSSYWYYK